MPDLIRHELTKLETLPPWGRPQGDQWDRLSRFIYRVQTLQGVQRQARAMARARALDEEAFAAYAVRRWFNHHTHDQILQMFLARPTIRQEENRQHRTIDFYLRDIPFDLKVSLFPRAYPENIFYAQQHPHHLALWQYKHQSREGRYHTGNRLFIVLHNLVQPELSWQLRRDFAALEEKIGQFLAAPTLLGLVVGHAQTGEVYYPWSGIIFHIT